VAGARRMAVAGAVATPVETEGVGTVWPPGAVAEPALCWATTILLAWGISLATGRWLLPGLALDGVNRARKSSRKIGLTLVYST
jgi:hypothetical protein